MLDHPVPKIENFPFFFPKVRMEKCNLKLKVFSLFVGEECKRAVIADPHHFRIVDEDGHFVSQESAHIDQTSE